MIWQLIWEYILKLPQQSLDVFWQICCRFPNRNLIEVDYPQDRVLARRLGMVPQRSPLTFLGQFRVVVPPVRAPPLVCRDLQRAQPSRGAASPL